jgi:capsular polysaccharide transport system permease protein
MSTRILPDHEAGTLKGAFRVQSRVIGALIMRELHTRYGRENIGYLWMILEPMTLALAVALLHAGSASHYGSDIRPVPFSIVGYTVFIIFRGIFTRAEGTIEANRPLLYHRMVTLLDMLVARALLEGAGVGTTLVLMLGLANVFDLATLPYRPLWLILGVFYMVWLSFAMSMICCAITHDNRLVARLIHPATYILMPLAGGFYMLKWIPKPYQDWLWYGMPFIHVFEMCRYGQFEAAEPTFIALDYLTGVCLALTLIGFLSLRIVRRHVHLS